MPYPLGAERLREFAAGLEEILVVEDKTAFLETQVREVLYGTPNAPRVLGKQDADGRPLIPADGELTAGAAARAAAPRPARPRRAGAHCPRRCS